ncbi:hypothetical protein [Streptomyces sp. NPDC049887]|uniref:hypothetical protein n=1 Tax=Streptomyces sp. NPDC049887 TaxID=3155654 RepID=UPI00341BD26A
MNGTPHRQDFSPWPEDGAVHQSAAPGASVGGQQAVGVNHGTVTQYVVHPDATPQERFGKGRLLLDAGLRARAEELIGEAVAQRLSGTEVLYRWALAIVSRRAVEDLTTDDMEKLHTLEHLLGERPADAYGRAARVVLLLLSEAFGQAPVDVGPDELAARRGDATATAIDSLPEARRVEVLDHLRHFLSEIVRERLDAEEADDIRAHRTDTRRAERVPLFFEPDPLPPLQVPAVVIPVTFRFKAMLGGGVLLVLAGLFTGVPTMFHGSAGSALVALLLLVGGGAAATWFGVDRAWRRGRARQEGVWRANGGPATRRYGQAYPGSGPGGPSPAQLAFAGTVDRIVDGHFARQVRSGEDFDAWWAVTAVPRADLLEELSDMYGPDNDPYGLDWLIRKHAQDTAGRWRAGLLTGGRRRRDVPLAVHAGFLGGLLALAGGVLTAGSAAADPGAFLQALAVWALGGYLVAKGAAPFRGEQLRRAVDREEFRTRWEGEQRTFGEWRAFLDAHQPHDWEMGRWLNYDMRHLRREALHHYDLRPHQIVYDFFVLEAGEGARRAKVSNGPVRYSVYRIRLYVMTERGIRLATWTVDFAEGTHHGRSDTSQRYESISSVKVDRKSVQLTDRRSGFRQAVTVLPDGSVRGNAESGELTLSEELVIERDSSHETRLRVENFTTTEQSSAEDLSHLLSLSQEVSGISTASRILVAVAAEGREWFDEQRRRNSRRFAETRERSASAARVQHLGTPLSGSATGPRALEGRDPAADA